MMSVLFTGVIRAEDLSGNLSAPPQIIGPIADGVVVPATPLPKLDIQPGDILQTRERVLGGRRIIVQQVAPMVLSSPQPVTESAFLSGQVTEGSPDEAPEVTPATVFVFVAATVYHFPHTPPRTLVRLSTPEHPEEVVCWSSANWNWLTGFGSFMGANGRHYVLMNSIANDKELNRDEVTLRIPEIPGGKASFVTMEGGGTQEIIAPLQTLHDLYHTEGERLKVAYEGREWARQQEEAALLADPPKPKDVVIRYWRVEAPEGSTQPAMGR